MLYMFSANLSSHFIPPKNKVLAELDSRVEYYDVQECYNVNKATIQLTHAIIAEIF